MLCCVVFVLCLCCFVLFFVLFCFVLLVGCVFFWWVGSKLLLCGRGVFVSLFVCLFVCFDGFVGGGVLSFLVICFILVFPSSCFVVLIFLL